MELTPPLTGQDDPVAHCSMYPWGVLELAVLCTFVYSGLAASGWPSVPSGKVLVRVRVLWMAVHRLFYGPKPNSRSRSHAAGSTSQFTPRHWLLYHLGLYKFEFEFGSMVVI